MKLHYHYMEETEKQEICSWKYDGIYGIYNLPPYEEMKQKNIAFCDDERAKNFYSFHDNTVLIGFVNILKEEHEVFIGIGVHPALCNHGYGHEMLDASYGISKKLYPDMPLYLEVRSWNERAINCYKRAVFVIDGNEFEQETSIGKGTFYRMIRP